MIKIRRNQLKSSSDPKKRSQDTQTDTCTHKLLKQQQRQA